MASRDAPTRIQNAQRPPISPQEASYFNRATTVASHRDIATACGRGGRANLPHRFGGAKMWLKKDLPDGRQVQRIFIPKGFDWVKTISPMLSKAGEGPVMW